MKEEEALKGNFVGVRVELGIIVAMKQAGLSISDFVRYAIVEKLERENLSFLQTKKKELQQELDKIEQREKLLINVKPISDALQPEELTYLLESKKLIGERPELLEGRINLYFNNFGKIKKPTRFEFNTLLERAVIQKGGYKEDGSTKTG